METTTDERLHPFDEHRPLLFSLAYEMLGSVADAEDVLQEAYLRWQRVDTPSVHSPRDYLCTIVTRLALDQLRSARARREVYVGPWLPEPLVGAAHGNALESLELSETLSTAFLLLLERLTPPQRAAFLLHEVFGYGYPEVARILETSEPNARQHVHRARRFITEGRPRFDAASGRADDLAQRFLDACTTGDVGRLVEMLAGDAVAWSDGGGRVAAARHPIRGAEHVARFLTKVVGKWLRDGEVRNTPVNGGPGLLAYIAGAPWAVLSVSARGGQVREIYLVANPDKLRIPPELAD